jgi:hypothetical protein
LKINLYENMKSVTKFPVIARHKESGSRGGLTNVKERQRFLPPSLLKIDGTDKTVTFNGYPSALPFDVGGRNGNIVISSQTPRVLKSWRIVAVNGTGCSREVLSVLTSAQSRSQKIAITFRFGNPSLEDGKCEADKTDELEARRHQEAAEMEARAAAELAARRQRKTEEFAEIEARAAVVAEMLRQNCEVAEREARTAAELKVTQQREAVEARAAAEKESRRKLEETAKVESRAANEEAAATELEAKRQREAAAEVRVQEKVKAIAIATGLPSRYAMSAPLCLYN